MTESTAATLFIPGPVEVDAELRDIMAMPLMGHRDPRFVSEVQSVCTKLQGLFRTGAHTLFENVPATGMMEAMVRNLVPAGGTLLHLTAGAFGERWSKVSTACGRHALTIATPWGKAPSTDTLQDALKQHPKATIHAVCITHSETSTGSLAPLAEIAKTARALLPNALILVDAVTSLGGAELEFDAWDLDGAFAGTQKCLALPPGLAVAALSDRALSRMNVVEDRGFLLDFERALAGMGKGRTVATPCVPLVFALSRQLDRIAAETMPARWQRHEQLQVMALEWAASHGLDAFVAEPTHRSPTVTCLQSTPELTAAFHAKAQAAGFAMDKGYGDLKGKTFRIGHMGDHPPERLARFLAAIG